MAKKKTSKKTKAKRSKTVAKSRAKKVNRSNRSKQKKQSLPQKFMNLPKVALFVIAFGLVGLAGLAYTNAQPDYNMAHMHLDKVNSINAAKVKETEGNKRNAQVVEVPNSATSSNSKATFSRDVPTGSWQACAIGKATKGSPSVTLRGREWTSQHQNGIDLAKTTFTLEQSSDYQEIGCITVDHTNSSTLAFYVENNSPDTSLRVSIIVVSKVNDIPASEVSVSTSSASENGELTWAPPQLDNPTTIDLNTENWTVKLDDSKDYILNMPDEPVTRALVIVGGRDVVMVGGEIAIPHQGSDPSISSRTGLKLKNQKGTVHIEGLLIHGKDISEGIQIDADDAIVQLQNLRVWNLHARDQDGFTDNHPDVVQPYGGAQELRIDMLTGESDYQGMFLVANAGSGPNELGAVKLSRINLHATPTTRYMLWKSGDYPVTTNEVYVDRPDGRTWDKTLRYVEDFPDVKEGQPANGDFVPETAVGLNYESPGYK
ncbi:MAG: hypothetical protein U5L95_04050 [Candidatus Saccharibacteria bacterium]|nr:hypothetical protein [Candidatus Saccharibacteria bacterium]